MKSASLTASLCLLAAMPAGFSGLLDDLDASKATQVRNGRQVLVTEDVSGQPWPRVKVYQWVDSHPEEAMAVFFDYNNAVKFVPNCIESQIARVISPTTIDVNYKVDVPILPDEAYTARNTLASGSGGQLSVKWEVLQATSIKSSEGSFVVEPFGGGSVLRYTNFVVPSSAAAGLLKGVAVSQMKDTVNALVSEVKKQKTHDGDQLEQRVDRMKEALGD